VRLYGRSKKSDNKKINLCFDGKELVRGLFARLSLHQCPVSSFSLLTTNYLKQHGTNIIPNSQINYTIQYAYQILQPTNGDQYHPAKVQSTNSYVQIYYKRPIILQYSMQFRILSNNLYFAFHLHITRPYLVN